jgi:hypothetical protein
MRAMRLASLKEPISLRAGIGRILRLEIVFAAVGVLFPPSSSCGGDKNSSPSTGSPVWIPSLTQPPNRVSDDLALGLRARKLLLQDAVLAGQTLGVSVRNRVAMVWGVVSSPIMALRAETCLRGLPGLAAVRSELSIEPQPERSGEGCMSPGSPAQLPPSRRVQGRLVHRVEEQAPAPSQEFRWRPAGRRESERVPVHSRAGSLQAERSAEKPAVESLPGFPSSDGAPRSSGPKNVLPSRLGTAVAVPVMPALVLPVLPAEGDSARPGLPAPPGGPQTASLLVKRIEALRLADDRFRGIRAEVRGDVVCLRGMVYSWDHLYELARSLSGLPGVRRVLFEEVRAESPGENRGHQTPVRRLGS